MYYLFFIYFFLAFPEIGHTAKKDLNLFKKRCLPPRDPSGPPRRSLSRLLASGGKRDDAAADRSRQQWRGVGFTLHDGSLDAEEKNESLQEFLLFGPELIGRCD